MNRILETRHDNSTSVHEFSDKGLILSTHTERDYGTKITKYEYENDNLIHIITTVDNDKDSEIFYEYNESNLKTLIRRIHRDDVYECRMIYDKEGNLIHIQEPDGYKCWYKHKNGKEVAFQDSNNFSRFKEYDYNGNLVHYTDSDNNEEIYEYEDNKLVHIKYPKFKFEKFLKYENGELIYTETNTGMIQEYIRESDKTIIHTSMLDTKGNSFNITKELDSKNREVFMRNTLTGLEEKTIYENDNVVMRNFYIPERNNETELYHYDNNNNLIWFKDRDGKILTFEYTGKIKNQNSTVIPHKIEVHA